MTNADLARSALAAIAAADIPFAVLHREPDVAERGVQSDIDLAVTIPPVDVILRAAVNLEAAGLRPVLVWPYDVAQIASVFLVSPAAEDGVQLDITCDLEGAGKLGLRTDVLVDTAVPGRMFPTLDSTRELLFLIRKRHVKRQMDRLRDLVAVARALPSDHLASVAEDMFSDRVRRDVLRVVSEFPSIGRARMPRRYRTRQAWRLSRRIARPIGYWVHLAPGAEAAATAAGVKARFGKLLVRSGASPVPGPLWRIPWVIRDMAPVLLRAGLFVSWGSGPGSIHRPHLRLGTYGDLDLAAATIVEAMAARVIGPAASSMVEA